MMKLSFVNIIKSIITVSILVMPIVGIVCTQAEADTFDENPLIQPQAPRLSDKDFDLWQGEQRHEVIVAKHISEIDVNNVVFSASTDPHTAVVVAIDSTSSFPQADESDSYGFCEGIGFSFNPEPGTAIAINNLEHLLELSVICKQ
jgi:hypothetical protein